MKHYSKLNTAFTPTSDADKCPLSATFFFVEGLFAKQRETVKLTLLEGDHLWAYTTQYCHLILSVTLQN